MSKKPRTPSQIAKEKVEKKTYSFSLIKSNAETIIKMATDAGLPASEIIDEAIAFYLANVKDQSK